MPKEDRSASHVWQLITFVLCVFVLAGQLGQAFLTLPTETVRLLTIADACVCIVFLADFAVQLALSPRKWRYFVTWGWLDLVSSIPAVPALRWGRSVRVLRILRVMRTARVAKHLGVFVAQNRARNTFLAVMLGAFLAIVCGAMAILNMETGDGANIATAGDALWWAFVTITTVGYGDCYPVTTGGRVVAAILMVFGVGLFGTFTAYVASFFLDDHDEEVALGSLRDEVRALRSEIADMRREMRQESTQQKGT